MARSFLKLRQEAERARVEAYEASLQRVSQRSRPAPDFDRAINEAMRGFKRQIVREACAWKPQMKSRDAARLRLAAARHLFARYPVAWHLEQIWIDDSGLGRNEIELRKRWYIAAASGGSLYKAGAGRWLSRKEVHAFANPPGRLGFEEALWHAIARTYATNDGDALRIARSKIARVPRGDTAFWREVVRFFCAHPSTVEEIDDLCDYLADCYGRNAGYSLKGRTLVSLSRQMREWHRDLEAIQRIEAQRRRAEHAHAVGAVASASWPGASIADWTWSPSTSARSRRGEEYRPKHNREEYAVVQLRTAADLVAETRTMRHCVASYAGKCIAGQASIWSLRHRAAGRTELMLTIELDRLHRAVQVRGFANRLPRDDEREILERWAKARGIVLL